MRASMGRTVVNGYNAASGAREIMINRLNPLIPHYNYALFNSPRFCFLTTVLGSAYGDALIKYTIISFALHPKRREIEREYSSLSSSNAEEVDPLEDKTPDRDKCRRVRTGSAWLWPAGSGGAAAHGYTHQYQRRAWPTQHCHAWAALVGMP